MSAHTFKVSRTVNEINNFFSPTKNNVIKYILLYYKLIFDNLDHEFKSYSM